MSIFVSFTCDKYSSSGYRPFNSKLAYAAKCLIVKRGNPVKDSELSGESLKDSLSLCIYLSIPLTLFSLTLFSLFSFFLCLSFSASLSLSGFHCLSLSLFVYVCVTLSLLLTHSLTLSPSHQSDKNLEKYDMDRTSAIRKDTDFYNQPQTGYSLLFYYL